MLGDFDVLFIDDEPDKYRDGLQGALEPLGLRAEVVHPDEVTKEHLAKCQLSLVDLKLTTWDPPRNSICGYTTRGDALIPVLRSHIQKRYAPTAFALLTNEPEDVASGIAQERAPYVAGQLRGFEWMFSKLELDSNAEHIRALVEATRSLNDIDKEPQAIDIDDVADWLSAPKDATGERLEATLLAIEQSRPPLHDIRHTSHTIALLRWLLHRILPYPGLLVGEYEVACRLGMSFERWSQGVEREDGVFNALLEFQYAGPAREMFTRRWWRPYIEDWLYQVTAGKSISPTAVRMALEDIPQTLSIGESIADAVPVVAKGTFQSYRIASRSDCVRVQPDDRPAFADAAWALKSDIATKGGDGIPLAIVLREDLADLESI